MANRIWPLYEMPQAPPNVNVLRILPKIVPSMRPRVNRRVETGAVIFATGSGLFASDAAGVLRVGLDFATRKLRIRRSFCTAGHERSRSAAVQLPTVAGLSSSRRSCRSSNSLSLRSARETVMVLFLLNPCPQLVPAFAFVGNGAMSSEPWVMRKPSTPAAGCSLTLANCRGASSGWLS
jgi:hypothetical protein